MGKSEFRMKRLFTLVIFIFIFIAFSGCSEFLYESFQEIERNDCYKLEDPQQRQDCLDRIDERSYDQYQKEREQYQKEREQYEKEQYEQYQKERSETQEQ